MYRETDVLILGGGIGGCSTAHVLRQNGFKGKITILEQNDRIGGEARSEEINIYDKQNGQKETLPTEHCWRIYGSGYTRLFQIMRQIPLIDNHDNPGTEVAGPNKTVYDNLVDLEPYLVLPTCDKAYVFNDNDVAQLWQYTQNVRKSLSTAQYLQLMNKLLYLSTSSTDRLKEEMTEISWKDFINAPTKEAYDYLIRVVGPFYGVDLYKASASSIWEVIENTNGPQIEPGVSLKVMNGPTNKSWFDHWHILLCRNQVEIITETRVTDIITDDNQVVQGVKSFDRKTGDVTSWKAKWYIFALPLQVISKLIYNPKLTELAQLGKQFMIGLQIYFSEKLFFPYPHAGVVLPESPWELIIEPQGSIWSKKYWDPSHRTSLEVPLNHGLRDPNHRLGSRDPDARDIWSIGICDPQSPGWLHKKPFLACTREEVEEEVWYQLQHTKSLHETITTESGKPFKDVKPLLIHLFDSYKFSEKNKRLETDEIKTSPNAGTWKLRPETQFLTNALFATSFTQNSREMILMDAAAEAGTRAANVILKQCGLNTAPNLSKRPRLREIAFAPLRAMDSLLNMLNLPHLSSFTGGSTIVIVLLYALLIFILIIVGFRYLNI
jgi:uncharacterized protein with NAD-binding domain and iron-sulfur cluster